MTSEPATEVFANGQGLPGMPRDRFVAQYWQRRPLLIRGALAHTDFASVDAATLRQAACADQVETRLMLDGQQQFGPFDAGDLPAEGDRDWILLVQEADRLFPAARNLLDRFDFLPHWRVDDLMISYATEGGSAGPHVDQYDAFLVQGLGRKRWAIDTTSNPDLTVVADHPMGILSQFNPDRQWTLEPGDALYLPPGVPHCGTALEAGTTWSVGFRAPSAGELWVELAEYQLARTPESLRFTDSAEGNLISRADLQQVRRLLGGLAIIDDAELALWFGQLVTRREIDPEPQDASVRREGRSLVPAPGVRVAWYSDADRGWLFVAGQAWPATPSLARLIGEAPRLDPAQQRQAAELDGDRLLDQLFGAGLMVEAET